MKMQSIQRLVYTSCAILILQSTKPAFATDSIIDCVKQYYYRAADSLTIGEIRKLCQQQQDSQTTELEDTIIPNKIEKPGAISTRITQERLIRNNPYELSAHRMNYFLPVLSTSAINKEAYSASVFDGDEQFLQDAEAKFQLSLKVPMNSDSLFIDGDAVYVAFTIEAWWQVYASHISKPFRETNYRPEIFYMAPLDWHPLAGNSFIILGFEHQSNGRTQVLSRSWNRVYANLLYDLDNFVLSFSPWLLVSNGDDNPDIDDYMGHFELGAAYKWHDYEFNLKSRQNFSKGNGAIEIGMTFPLWGKVRGYVTAFNGYGESLIDYNHRQTRFGLGIALNNIL
jgi:phospholipase A1